MATGFHNILSKCDRALVAYLISVDCGTVDDVYPAKLSADKSLPNTVCHSQKWKPLLTGSGIAVVNAQIMIHTDPNIDVDESAEDKTDASEDRVSNTFDAFHATKDSDLAAAITAAARATGDADLQEFTVQSVFVEGGDAGYQNRAYTQGNAWMDAIDLEIVCCPSVV